MERLNRCKKRGSLAGLLVILITVSGCDGFATDPERGVTARTDRSEYVWGETVVITLYNGYRRQVSHRTPGCVPSLWLERLTPNDGRWEDALDPPTPGSLPCVNAGRVLSPGDTIRREFVTDRPEVTAPGTYRIRVPVTLRSSSTEDLRVIYVFSNTFEILPAEGTASAAGR